MYISMINSEAQVLEITDTSVMGIFIYLKMNSGEHYCHLKTSPNHVLSPLLNKL